MTTTDIPAGSPLRVAFAGTPDFAARHLEALLAERDKASFELVAVYTQPDRPAGRGKRLTPSPVKKLALEHSLPVCQPMTLKDPAAQAQLAEFKPDIVVVVAYGLLLPKAILEIPRLGCINVHASLLPRWRGAAPIQRSIEAGDDVTGVTIMQMDEGLDTGAMLIKEACDIKDTDTAASLHDKLATLGAPALIKALLQLSGHKAQPEIQDDTLSTYAAKISKDEARIDWQQDAEVLARKIRAFNPSPVAFSVICEERVRIWQANIAKMQHSSEPGMLLESTNKGLLVACGNDALLLTEIQLSGKKRLPVAEILKSRDSLFTPGNCFKENHR